MKRIFLLLAAALLPIACSRRAPDPANVRAELVADTKTIHPGRPFRAGVRFKINPGWHIYWRDPGDSGMATEIRWTLPAGFSASEILWPAPEKFTDSAGTTFGYKEEVFLSARITPPPSLKEGERATLSAEALWLECKDICVPGKARLALTLPVALDEPASP